MALWICSRCDGTVRAEGAAIVKAMRDHKCPGRPRRPVQATVRTAQKAHA